MCFVKLVTEEGPKDSQKRVTPEADLFGRSKVRETEKRISKEIELV